MFFSGVSRNSQDITTQKIKCIKSKPSEVIRLGDYVDQSLSILNSNACVSEFGKLYMKLGQLNAVFRAASQQT